jgi:23S rRNA (pseudouridine1915-N3)-methyltransferase
VHIQVLMAGSISEPFLRRGAAEYARRLSRYCRVEVVSVRDEPVAAAMSAADLDAARRREAERLRARLGPGAFVVALDAPGKELTSEELAAFLAARIASGVGRVAFLVGGTTGLHQSLKDAADLVLSLSRLTLPHQMVPLVLLEQLYRAFRILRREPYHW